MATPDVNSPEFFGLEPGTPEVQAFEQDIKHSVPDVSGTDPKDYVDYQPDLSRSLLGVSLDDQRVIKDLVSRGWDPETAIKATIDY